MKKEDSMKLWISRNENVKKEVEILQQLSKKLGSIPMADRENNPIVSNIKKELENATARKQRCEELRNVAKQDVDAIVNEEIEKEEEIKAKYAEVLNETPFAREIKSNLMAEEIEKISKEVSDIEKEIKEIEGFNENLAKSGLTDNIEQNKLKIEALTNKRNELNEIKNEKSEKLELYKLSQENLEEKYNEQIKKIKKLKEIINIKPEQIEEKYKQEIKKEEEKEKKPIGKGKEDEDKTSTSPKLKERLKTILKRDIKSDTKVKNNTQKEEEYITVTYRADKDEYVVGCEENGYKQIYSRKELEKQEVKNLEEGYAENSETPIDLNVLKILKMFDKESGTDKASQYLKTARLPGITPQQRENEIIDVNKIQIDYYLKGLYNKKSEISKEERKQILKIANEAAKSGIAYTEKGPIVWIREKIENIIDTLKGRKALGKSERSLLEEGKEESKEEENDFRDDLKVKTKITRRIDKLWEEDLKEETKESKDEMEK